MSSESAGRSSVTSTEEKSREEIVAPRSATSKEPAGQAHPSSGATQPLYRPQPVFITQPGADLRSNAERLRDNLAQKEAARINRVASPKIEVPEGADPPETLTETLETRDEISEEARSEEHPLVTGVKAPVDTSTPTNSTTTTNPPMGVPDDTEFTSPKEAKADAKKASAKKK